MSVLDPDKIMAVIIRTILQALDSPTNYHLTGHVIFITHKSHTISRCAKPEGKYILVLQLKPILALLNCFSLYNFT